MRLSVAVGALALSLGACHALVGFERYGSPDESSEDPAQDGATDGRTISDVAVGDGLGVPPSDADVPDVNVPDDLDDSAVPSPSFEINSPTHRFLDGGDRVHFACSVAIAELWGAGGGPSGIGAGGTGGTGGYTFAKWHVQPEEVFTATVGTPGGHGGLLGNGAGGDPGGGDGAKVDVGIARGGGGGGYTSLSNGAGTIVFVAGGGGGAGSLSCDGGGGGGNAGLAGGCPGGGSGGGDGGSSATNGGGGGGGGLLLAHGGNGGTDGGGGGGGAGHVVLPPEGDAGSFTSAQPDEDAGRGNPGQPGALRVYCDGVAESPPRPDAG